MKKTKCYTVTLEFTGLTDVLVEAKSEKEARKIVKKQYNQLFCGDVEDSLKLSSDSSVNDNVILCAGKINDVYED